MASIGAQISTLVWKHATLQKRRILGTILVFGIPVLLFVMISMVRSSEKSKDYDDRTYKPFCLLPVANKCQNNTITNMFKLRHLAYAPKTESTEDLMKRIQPYFEKVLDFPSVEDLEAHFMQEKTGKTLAGVVFDKDFGTNSDKVTFTIRFPALLSNKKSGKDNSSGDLTNWATDQLFSAMTTAMSVQPLYADSETGPKSPNYYSEGFLTLQQLLFMALTDYNNVTEDLPKIQLQRFPSAAWTEDTGLFVFSMLLPVIIAGSYYSLSVDALMDMATEKDCKMKDMFVMMGVSRFTLWMSWFIKIFIIFSLISIIVILFLKVGAVTSAFFPKVNFGVLLIFFLLYMLASTTYIFCLSVFCSKPTTASTLGQLILALGLLMSIFYGYLPLGLKIAFSFFTPMMPMTLCVKIIGFYEVEKRSFSGSDLWETTPVEPDLNFGYGIIFLIVDCIIYLFIAVAFENFRLADHDIWWMWKRLFKRKVQDSSERQSDVEKKKSTSSTKLARKNFEAPPKNLKVGIEIKDLVKVYGGRKVVKGLSMDIYEGEITVLLGHNGAGKTTTISMLTGLIPATEGKVFMSGVDLLENPKDVRKSIGVCPQNDVIIPNLTVREHIMLFARLKGLHKTQAKEEADKFLKMLEFDDKADTRAKKLSGGMKRKLCVCMAMCGGSTVIFLDEPTSGMDPAIRRTLWDFLVKQKSNKTIVLTTHFMDEADVLGDRTAIIADGVLECMGSNYFLKKRFGSGYHLTMDKMDSCRPEKVTALIRQHIPAAELSSNIGSELSYTLPESATGNFEGMMKALESNMEKLGIASYGISVTTLEEVFMKIGAEHYKVSDDAPKKKLEINETRFESGMTLVCNQCNAAFISCLGLMTSKLFATCIAPFYLLLFIWIGSFSQQQMHQAKELPALPLTLAKYDDITTLVSPEDSKTPLEKIYVDNVLEAKDFKYKENVTKFMLEETKAERYYSKKHYIVGADFKDADTVTAFFNGDPLHSTPLSLSLVLNTLYKKARGSEDDIQFVNYPFIYKPETLSEEKKTNPLLPFLYCGAFVLVVGGISVYLLYEKVTMVKHQLMVSGMHPLIYWTIYFCIHMTYLLFLLIFAVVLLFAFDSIHEFDTFEDYELYVVPTLVFFLCCLPFVYALSFIPSQEGLGTALITGVMVGVLFIYFIIKGYEWGKTVAYILYSAPPVLFLVTIEEGQKMKLLEMGYNKITQMCRKLDPCIKSIAPPEMIKVIDNPHYSFENPYGLRIFIGLFLFLIYFLLVFLIELKLFRPVISCLCGCCFTTGEVKSEDDDVENENKKIRETDIEELKQRYPLILKDVSKSFCSFKAVQSLCLGIKPGECFGLVGVNGAGKTTTFRMMTGEISSTTGEIYLKGYNVQTSLRKTHKFIGYCPQFDALIPSVKVKTALKIYCLVRGIPRSEIKQTIAELGDSFGFTRHINKRVEQLSGGNKRKVSTAIACLGYPEILYLDEPTTGMDPVAKRHIWNIVCALRDSGRSVVLTSHSMEECEALCTRVVIMVNGQFKCLGSLQHLKNKLSKGCTIIVRAKRSASEKDIEEIEAYMKSQFAKVVLKERHQTLMVFHIIGKNLVWSSMFKIMENAKGKVAIADYSIGQNNLEQVFLSFTSYQTEK